MRNSGSVDTPKVGIIVEDVKVDSVSKVVDVDSVVVDVGADSVPEVEVVSVDSDV